MTAIRIIFLMNVVAYVLCSDAMIQGFGVHYFFSPNFYLHQVLTYMFLHGSFLHIAFNMFCLFTFGNMLCKMWGNYRFVAYYLTCGLGAAVVFLLTSLTKTEGAPLMIGSSGAIFGLLVAFAMTFPDQEMNLFFTYPIKAKHIVFLYGAIEILLGFISFNTDISAHSAHLGGMLTGFVFLSIAKTLRV